jgi:hypothetical protein
MLHLQNYIFVLDTLVHISDIAYLIGAPLEWAHVP